MKKLKRGLAALLAGQFLVMRKKDTRFKKQLHDKSGWDKVTFVFKKLFDFNKDLFEEGRRTVESTNFKAEFEALKDKATLTLDNIETYTESKKQEIITDLQEQFALMQTKAKEFETDLDEKYHWKDKWKELKALITKLKKQLP